MYEKGIETFLAVAMSHTLGHAAELLNVKQSTVSYNLNELEKEIGMILIDRQKGIKGIQLTPAGESFLPLALKWQETMKEIANLRAPGSSYSLTIGASESVNTKLIPELYKKLIRYAPPIYLRIITDTSDMMYEAVENRALDCAITLHEEKSRYVKTEPFYKERFVVARIPYANEEVCEIIEPSMLDEKRELYIEWSAGYRLWHDHIWNTSLSFKTYLDSLNLAVKLISERGDWCIIPESAVPYFKSSVSNAVFQKLSESPPDVIYYKLTHKYPKITSLPGLAVFDELLQQTAEELNK